MEITKNQPDAEVIARLASNFTEQLDATTDVYHVVPTGYELKSTEALAYRPSRPRGNTELLDEESFISFVTRTGRANIYFTAAPPRFVAVFNDHDTTVEDDGPYVAPGWRDHTATYACPLSPEWKDWTANSGRQMSQEDFARFIEDNLPDIVSPPAADMLEISRSLEAKKKVNFASGIRLSNGANELAYEETIQGTAAKGKLTVPETFALGIPVFEGGVGYKVEARLRYRISDGGRLTMSFELVRPHKILEDAVANTVKRIAEGTGRPVFRGVAAAITPLST